MNANDNRGSGLFWGLKGGISGSEGPDTADVRFGDVRGKWNIGNHKCHRGNQ